MKLNEVVKPNQPIVESVAVLYRNASEAKMAEDAAITQAVQAIVGRMYHQGKQQWDMLPKQQQQLYDGYQDWFAHNYLSKEAIERWVNKFASKVAQKIAVF